MKKEKSLFTSILLGITLTLLVPFPAFSAEYITVLTGGTSGIYYPLGVAFANILRKELPDSQCTAQSTKASVENLNLLQAGRGEIGFATADSVMDAYNGVKEAGFSKPLKKLRGIADIYPSFVQVVARADSGIKSISDMKGKRVSVGAPKSGTELNAKMVTAAAGLTYDDFAKVEYLDFGQSVELMKNRQIDAAFITGGLGISALRDLSSAIDMVVVSIPPETAVKTISKGYVAGIIPAKTYTGQDRDVATVRTANVIITRADLDNDTVYAITKALFTNGEQLAAAHSVGKDIHLKNAIEIMPLPLHPGAEKYYREMGILK